MHEKGGKAEFHSPGGGRIGGGQRQMLKNAGGHGDFAAACVIEQRTQADKGDRQRGAGSCRVKELRGVTVVQLRRDPGGDPGGGQGGG